MNEPIEYEPIKIPEAVEPPQVEEQGDNEPRFKLVEPEAVQRDTGLAKVYQKFKDDCGDLFETPYEGDGWGDIDSEDLVTIDPYTDVIDVNEDGNLDDLFVVTDEDIMGDELGRTSGRYISKKERRVKRQREMKTPPTSLGRIRL